LTAQHSFALQLSSESAGWRARLRRAAAGPRSLRHLRLGVPCYARPLSGCRVVPGGAPEPATGPRALQTPARRRLQVYCVLQTMLPAKLEHTKG